MRKRSDAEGVSESDAVGKRWVQQTFFPPDVVRVSLTMHLEPGADRFDYDVEISDPETKELLAMLAAPSQSTTSILNSLTVAMRRLSDLVYDCLDPAPF